MATKPKPKKPVVTEKKEFKYVVEHGVELVSVRMRPRADCFPFEVMKPGDSFLIPASDPVSKNANTLHYAAKQHARMNPGFIISTRRLLDKSRRVWRLK